MRISKHLRHVMTITGTVIASIISSGNALAGIAQPIEPQPTRQESKALDKSLLNATHFINRLPGILTLQGLHADGIHSLQHPLSDLPALKGHHEISTEAVTYSHDTVYYNHLNIPVTSSKIGLYYKINF